MTAGPSGTAPRENLRHGIRDLPPGTETELTGTRYGAVDGDIVRFATFDGRVKLRGSLEGRDVQSADPGAHTRRREEDARSGLAGTRYPVLGTGRDRLAPGGRAVRNDRNKRDRQRRRSVSAQPNPN